MQFKSFVLSALLAVSANAAALSLTRAANDVWVPKITSPVTGTVWVIGTRVKVTWSLDDEPANVSNGGKIFLRKAGQVTSVGDLTPAFDLKAADGSFELTVPVVTPGSDYEIILFGDSGNISEDFTIAAA
ncbi:hypothetical protein C8J56DRAFT_826742 [Mycena floridula]|nr:hypothetical protein C8J56DRAFT_826742 [Mycena floridula]